MFVCFIYSEHLLPYVHRLEITPRDILIHLLFTSHKSSVNSIWQVLQPSHPNKRGSKQFELQSLRWFSTLLIQQPWMVVYKLYHITSWDTDIWILTYCLLYLNFSFLTVYTYFPISASGYLPPLIYFRTSSLGCFIFPWWYFTLLEYPSIPWITFDRINNSL